MWAHRDMKIQIPQKLGLTQIKIKKADKKREESKTPEQTVAK